MFGNKAKPTMSASSPISITGNLISLVVAVLLPAVFLAMVFIQFGQDQQAARQREIQETVRLIRVRLDHEIGRMYDLLRVLTSSVALRSGNYEAFYQEAKSILEIRGSVVVLRDLSGQQLVNTALPWGTALPVLKGRLDALILETGGPVVSNLIEPSNAPVLRTNLFVVSAPIKRDGAIIQYLSLGGPTELIRDILLERRYNDGEIAVVGDSEGRIIARSLRHQESVGKLLPKSFMQSVRQSGGWWQGVNFEGVPIVTAYELSRPFSHSNSPWVVSLGMTKEAFEAPLRHKHWLLGIFGTITIATAIVWLLFTTRQLSHKFARASSDLYQSNLKLQIVLDELNHRVKNMLARIQSISQITARGYTTVDEFREAFEKRLISMARTHDVLLSSGTGEALLRLTLLAELETYCAAGAVTLGGPDVSLSNRQTTVVGMVVHELTTNAIKYGALSHEGGTVAVTWLVEGNQLVLVWDEQCQKQVAPSSRGGFGSKLINSLVQHDLAGAVKMSARPLGWRVEISFAI